MSPGPWKLLTLKFLIPNNDLPIYLCALVLTVQMEIHCRQMRAWLTVVIMSLYPWEHQYIIILKHYSIYNVVLIIYKQEQTLPQTSDNLHKEVCKTVTTDSSKESGSQQCSVMSQRMTLHHAPKSIMMAMAQ